MGEWKDAGNVSPSEGGAVRVKVKWQDTLTEEKGDQIATTVSAARKTLDYTIAELGSFEGLSPRVKGLMGFFFGNAQGRPNMADFLFIKSNYELIVNGINAAGLSIKIKDTGHQGYVIPHDEEVGKRPKPRTKGTYTYPDGTTQEVWRGDIHLRSDVLAKRDSISEFHKPVQIFLHEASHKFASARDVAYLDDATHTRTWLDPVSMKPFEPPGIDEMRMNADSYGWFATKVFYFAPN